MNGMNERPSKLPANDRSADPHGPSGSPWGARPVVLSTADDKFALPLAVMLRSLADNLTWTPRVDVYVLDCGISARNKWRIRRSLPAGTIRIRFVPVPMDCLGGIHLDGYWTRSVYAKLLMGLLLPADISRAIFIDADTLVLRDIGELWELDLEGKVLGAVPDPTYKLNEALLWGGDLGFWGVTPDTPYFNSGLMVLDLVQWQSQDVGERALRMLREHPQRMFCVDQGALNAVLKGDFKAIGPAWNVTWLFYDLAPGTFAGEEGERRKQTYRNPRMIHFWGPRKPWTHPGPYYGADRFFVYLHRTAWRNAVDFAPWKNDALAVRVRRRAKAWKARLFDALFRWREFRRPHFPA